MNSHIDIYRLRNKIHPTAIIGDNVFLGSNNIIDAYAVIEGNTIIGDNNHFFPFCSVGTEPEHKSFYGSENKGVKIGSDNVIRESVTINSGCYRMTKLGNGIWMLKGSHVGHDTIVGDNCVVGCNVIFSGHCYIGKHSNIGLGVVLHQFSVIGGGSMLGMGAVVTKQSKIEPFCTYVGNPARYLKPNQAAINKISEVHSIAIKADYLYQLENNRL
jgi:UDP-N-acetylglucosamine acyltransferase